MAGAYVAPPGDQLGALLNQLAAIKRRLSVLERPTGTQLSSLVAQVQAALANIAATVAAEIAANSLTTSEIEALVAAPGNISPGNVIAAGQVQSNGAPLKSLPSHNYTVSSGYVATWTDGDGTIGTSPSTGTVKKDLAEMTADDARNLLSLTPYWGRYVWDDADSPLKVFFLAEDVRAAGFGPDVAPTVVGEPLQLVNPDGTPVLDADGNQAVVPVGQAWTVNYSQMVVPLIAAWHDGAQQMAAMQAQIAELTAQVQGLVAGGYTVDGGS